MEVLLAMNMMYQINYFDSIFKTSKANAAEHML